MNYVFKKENPLNFKTATSNERGFTIIELIISIFILTVAVVGIFSIFSVMVILTADAADKLTATYLAQEGIEIVSNIRDSNWLNMDACAADPSCTSTYNWDDGLGVENQNCEPPTGCTGDYKTGTLVSGASPLLTPWSNNYLNIDSNGFYNDSAGTQTKFKRKILITPVTDANETSDYILNVEVQVSWDQKATILSSGVSANYCCPDSSNSNCPKNAANCIKLDSTMYDWYNYNKNIPVAGS